MESSSPGLVLSVDHDFESYGMVPPWDAPLLKILPNGFPVFQPPTFTQESLLTDIDNGIQSVRNDFEKALSNNTPNFEEADDCIAMVNRLVLTGEKRIKRIVEPSNALHQKMEKLFLLLDYKFRESEMKRDPVCRNSEIWARCAAEKSEAIRHLLALNELLQKSPYFLTSDSNTSQGSSQPVKQQVALQPWVKTMTPEEQWNYLFVILARRFAHTIPLMHQAEMMAHMCRSASRVQIVGFRAVEAIRKYWRIQKVPYAKHVFDKGDTYPYRAEFRVDLMSIPWTCWGYDKPCRWALPPHLKEPGDPDAGECFTPPFLCWPPLPAAPPFARATAEVFFVPIREAQPDADCMMDRVGTQGQISFPVEKKRTFGIQVQWAGDASHCIESRRLLSVRIKVSSLVLLRPCATTTVYPVSNPRRRRRLLPDPYPLEAPDRTPVEAFLLHKRLQEAQWSLVDRAVHLVFQAQAAKLKPLLDIAAHGTPDAGGWATNVLREFERYSDVLHIRHRQIRHGQDSSQPHGESPSPAENQIAGGTEPAVVSFKRELIVNHWETYSTSFTLRGIPIYERKHQNPAKQPQQRSTETATASSHIAEHINHTPKFVADFDIWVRYTSPEEEEDYCEQEQDVETLKNVLDTPDLALSDETDNTSATLPSAVVMRRRLFQKLQQTEEVATCILRHLFLQTWKKATRDIPRNTFDLYNLPPAIVTGSSATSAGQNRLFFFDFIDWLCAYVSTQTL